MFTLIEQMVLNAIVSTNPEHSSRFNEISRRHAAGSHAPGANAYPTNPYFRRYDRLPWCDSLGGTVILVVTVISRPGVVK
jgi:hypothetical protein